MKSAEWYFDFISPFSYLQLEAFDRLPPDVKLTLRPVLFAGLSNHWGHKGPAEIPEKRRFTYRFVQWLAERQGVPMKFPPVHPFNPIKALRLAIAAGSDIASVRTIFRHIWREGKSIDDAVGWRELCQSIGIASPDMRINEPQVKEELKRNGERAVAAGVFGVPSFIIDGELFWGADATEMIWIIYAIRSDSRAANSDGWSLFPWVWNDRKGESLFVRVVRGIPNSLAHCCGVLACAVFARIGLPVDQAH
jgi:2-hydroxychromene-2-carboxylate isomerase